MPITTETYNQTKIDSIANLLTLNEQQGTAIDFEVWVDTLKVIPRTDDARRFETYADFVTADTRSVTILLYNGQSNRNDKYIFRLKEEPQSEGLQGIGLDDRIHEKLSSERQKWDFELLENKNQRLKKDLKEAEEYIDQLEESITKLRTRKFHLGNVNLGELGSVMLEGFIRRNPQMLSKLPGGEALAGVIEADNEEGAMVDENRPVAAPESEVTVSEKATPNLSETDRHYLELLQQVRAAFGEVEFVKVMELLDHLSHHPERIDPILTELNQPEVPQEEPLNKEDDE
ncbi:MAG: hypothetical protein AAF597_14080 [Bacteroidota bacterium]